MAVNDGQLQTQSVSVCMSPIPYASNWMGNLNWLEMILTEKYSFFHWTVTSFINRPNEKNLTYSKHWEFTFQKWILKLKKMNWFDFHLDGSIYSPDWWIGGGIERADQRWNFDLDQIYARRRQVDDFTKTRSNIFSQYYSSI